jgi:alanyl-tRNA synthetase
LKAIEQLQKENDALTKQIQEVRKEQATNMIDGIASKAIEINGVNFIAVKLGISSQMAKDLAFEMKKKVDNLFLVIGNIDEGKPGVTVMLSDNLVADKSMHAGNIVRELAREIQGGGGGQPHFATAGGKNADGLDKVIARAVEFVNK